MLLSRIFLVGLFVFLSQGCSKNNNTWIRDRAEDYKKSAVQTPLLMPEEFKTIPRSDRYYID
jgi:hypothetical protein